jgi:hypothetical protein
MLLQVMLGTFTGDGLEVFVETGKIIEAALITALFNADPVIDE